MRTPNSGDFTSSVYQTFCTRTRFIPEKELFIAEESAVWLE